MVASRDADSALRVLISDYAHFTMAPERKGRRPSHLLVDEFAAIGGGRRVAIDLLERGRGAGSGVTLSGQSSVALGPEEDRARLLAAASAVLQFRSPIPGEVAALAGSERVAEGAWQAEGEELTGRSTITVRSRARVDQDRVRQLPVGEAELVVGGQVERVRIIKTNIDANTRAQARELVAGQDRPRPAVALAGNPAPSQGPMRPQPGSYPLRHHRVKALRPLRGALRAALTRRRLRGSGGTGRLRRAGAARPATARGREARGASASW